MSARTSLRVKRREMGSLKRENDEVRDKIPFDARLPAESRSIQTALSHKTSLFFIFGWLTSRQNFTSETGFAR